MSTTTVAQSSYLETVPLGESKIHLRISSEEYDTEVERVVASSVDWCEQYTGRTLRTAVSKSTVYPYWSDICKSFPAQPVLAVQAIKYFDSENIEQTLSTSSYRLIRSSGGAARVELDEDFVLPETANRSDAVHIEYTTGYATVDDIPDRAKQAIKMMLSVFWGDLSSREVETWERQARMVLGSLDWGSYR